MASYYVRLCVYAGLSRSGRWMLSHNISHLLRMQIQRVVIVVYGVFNIPSAGRPQFHQQTRGHDVTSSPPVREVLEWLLLVPFSWNHSHSQFNTLFQFPFSRHLYSHSFPFPLSRCVYRPTSVALFIIILYHYSLSYLFTRYYGSYLSLVSQIPILILILSSPKATPIPMRFSSVGFPSDFTFHEHPEPQMWRLRWFERLGSQQ